MTFFSFSVLNITHPTLLIRPAKAFDEITQWSKLQREKHYTYPEDYMFVVKPVTLGTGEEELPYEKNLYIQLEAAA